VKFSDAVTDFLAGYFSTCRRSAKTQTAYRIDLAQLQVHVGTIELESIEADCMERWAAALQAQKYASVSIRRKFASARLLFGYWVRKKVIERSPLWKIRLDLGHERFLPRNLASADAKLLIEQVWRRLAATDGRIENPGDARFLRIRDLAAIEILFATGMRVGELVSLRLRDWRDDEATFIVSGKGSRQRLALLPDERSMRAVRMYLSCRQAMHREHDGLLLNATGNKISTQGIARVITKTAEAAGVPIRVTPHMLRHTVATLLLRNGADIRVVQEVLGHASIATTQRYTHISKEHLFDTLRSRHPNQHLDIGSAVAGFSI
jgi:integrase/recombinase XerD